MRRVYAGAHEHLPPTSLAGTGWRLKSSRSRITTIARTSGHWASRSSRWRMVRGRGRGSEATARLLPTTMLSPSAIAAAGVPPYHNIHPMRAIFMIPSKDAPTVQDPESWSPAFIAFIARCLQKDPKRRPTAKELQSDIFVAGACARPRATSLTRTHPLPACTPRVCRRHRPHQGQRRPLHSAGRAHRQMHADDRRGTTRGGR